MQAAVRAHAGPLFGRRAETEVLTSLLDAISSGGGALVMRGEPGRTIGIHLHRAFPKLGITTRSELQQALGAPAPHVP